MMLLIPSTRFSESDRKEIINAGTEDFNENRWTSVLVRNEDLEYIPKGLTKITTQNFTIVTTNPTPGLETIADNIHSYVS